MSIHTAHLIKRVIFSEEIINQKVALHCPDNKERKRDKRQVGLALLFENTVSDT